jgi:TPP-dependent pyruvate/acetoin dehydrogenase alpha subunit
VTVATTVDRHGQVAEDWRVGLSDEQLREILGLLKLCRYFDERMEALYRQGKLPGAIYSGRGQEGTHVGVVFALRRTTPCSRPIATCPHSSRRASI